MIKIKGNYNKKILCANLISFLFGLSKSESEVSSSTKFDDSKLFCTKSTDSFVLFRL